MRYPYHHGGCHHPNDDMIMPVVKLAQAWVPYQQYRCFFTLPVGWDVGTIFQELYQPYKRKKR